MDLQDRKRVLVVVNKKIPENDYRIASAGLMADVDFVFGLPERSDNVPQEGFVELHFTEGLNLKNFSELISLRKVLRGGDPGIDFVHFFSTILILFGPLVARSCGVRCAITVTGLGRTFDQEFFGSSVLRAVYKRLMAVSVAVSDRVLFQNRGHMRLFESWFPGRADRFCYVGSAVAMQRSPESPKLTTGINVIHVARLLPSKGIDDFLDVASELASEEGFAFHIVGPPSVGYSELHQRVREASELGVVNYHGELTGDSLMSLYSESHVLYFPSTGEGMARVMLEAGFSGLYPVAYDIPANLDLVDDTCGTLVKCGDTESVVRVLRSLKNDQEAMHRAATRYSRRIEKDFSVESYSARVSEALDGFLRPSGPDPGAQQSRPSA